MRLIIISSITFLCLIGCEVENKIIGKNRIYSFGETNDTVNIEGSPLILITDIDMCGLKGNCLWEVVFNDSISLGMIEGYLRNVIRTEPLPELEMEIYKERKIMFKTYNYSFPDSMYVLKAKK